MECLGFFPIPILVVAVVFLALRRGHRRECPACGTRNPAQANYCRRCGIGLQA